MTEQSRQGLAARVALHPAGLDRALEDDGLGLLAQSLTPLVGLGITTETRPTGPRARPMRRSTSRAWN